MGEINNGETETPRLKTFKQIISRATSLFKPAKPETTQPEIKPQGESLTENLEYDRLLDNQANAQEGPDIIQTATERGNKSQDQPPLQEMTESEQVRLTKDQIIRELEARNIYDFEPNVLSQEEISDLRERVKQKIEEEKDPARRVLFNELIEFIEKNGAIFPEFSQGTSGATLMKIMREGILSRKVVKERSRTGPIYGEGKRGGHKEKGENSSWVAAGAGLGGLGTAIAYAQETEDPFWNPSSYLHSALEYQRRIQEIDEKIEQVEITPEEKISLEEERLPLEATHKFLREIEYPIVYGFNRSEKINGILDKELYWATEPRGVRKTGSEIAYQRTVKKTGNEGNYGELDSEVFFPEDDIIPPDAIAVIACPSRMKEDVGAIIFGRQSKIQVVSLEMFDLLPEVGINRSEEARRKTLLTIQMNALAHAFRPT